MNEPNMLIKKIEKVREQLTHLVKEKGYTHDETIKMSQYLDFLLNQFEAVKNK